VGIAAWGGSGGGGWGERGGGSLLELGKERGVHVGEIVIGKNYM